MLTLLRSLKSSRAFSRFNLIVIVLFVLISQTQFANAGSGDALYFSLLPASALPPQPSSLLIQSPGVIKVPQGALLTVHLLRGDALVATSTLEFLQAIDSDRVIPPVPIASFVNSGSPTDGGEPLPGARLISGATDLSKVAGDPSRYRLVWMLSSGVMATPGRAVATGSPVGLVDLKLNAVSAATALGDQKPGSVLFFNRFTSSASNPLSENTQLNITNTSATSTAYLRLFLVNASTCETTNYGICLDAQETMSLQLSDLDPGVRGYVVAVATNAQGEPIQFNWLIGNVIVKQSAANIGRDFTSVLSALAIAKRNSMIVSNTGGSAEMVFDDVNYERLPGQVAFDSVPSQLNALNSTTISLYRPSSNLMGEVASSNVQLSAWGKNDQNQVITSGGNVAAICYSDFAVSTLRLSPVTIAQLLPIGSTAWIAASNIDGQPVLGSQLNSGEFNSGSNGRPLTLVTEYKIRIPVIPVTCQ
jgi:hypothetical protein